MGNRPFKKAVTTAKLPDQPVAQPETPQVPKDPTSPGDSQALRKASSLQSVDLRGQFSPRELEIIHTHLKDFIFHQPSTARDLEVLRRHWLRLHLFDQNASTHGHNHFQTSELVPAIVLLFDAFYRVLFDLAPQLRPLFHSSLQFQGRVFMYLIDGFKGLLLSGDLFGKASHLAKLHSCYGIKYEYFNPIGLAMMQSLESLDPRGWTYDVETAWRAVYCHIAMLALSHLERDLQRKNSKRFDFKLLNKTVSNKDLITKENSVRSCESKTANTPSTSSLNSVTESSPVYFTAPAVQVENRRSGKVGTKANSSSSPTTFVQDFSAKGLPHMSTATSLASDSPPKQPQTPQKIAIMPKKQSTLQRSSSKNQLEDVVLAAGVDPLKLSSFKRTTSSINSFKGVLPNATTNSFKGAPSNAESSPESPTRRRNSVKLSIGPILTAPAATSLSAVMPIAETSASSPRGEHTRVARV